LKCVAVLEKDSCFLVGKECLVFELDSLVTAKAPEGTHLVPPPEGDPPVADGCLYGPTKLGEGSKFEADCFVGMRVISFLISPLGLISGIYCEDTKYEVTRRDVTELSFSVVSFSISSLLISMIPLPPSDKSVPNELLMELVSLDTYGWTESTER